MVTILTTQPRARSGRREVFPRTTPTADQGHGALCHARLRPAWLRCGPESFPEALGSHRGAESKAVITLGKVCDRRRERPPIRGSEQSSLSDSLVVSVGGAFRVGAQGTCGVPGRLGVEQKVLSGRRSASDQARVKDVKRNLIHAPDKWHVNIPLIRMRA